MKNNNQTNEMIKWFVVAMDFLLLNLVLLGMYHYYEARMMSWPSGLFRIFWIGCNIALMLSETKFSTVIHMRMVSAGDVIRRVMLLTMSQAVLAYLFMKSMFFSRFSVGRHLLVLGTVLFILLVISRYLERRVVKRFRQLGRNTRRALFVGSDPELLRVYEQLVEDPTMGYRIIGYYGEAPEIIKARAAEKDGKRDPLPDVECLGTIDDLMHRIDEDDETLTLGDEVYVCLSRRERQTIKKISDYCDAHVKRFFYVPVSVETLGINLKSELMNDMEVYTTYENPLQNPVNKAVKRLFDIVLSGLFLICALPFFPIIALIIKIQSPGPVLFKQLRTGIDGKDFKCYKFRSMHVNKDADKLQATKDDPRKFPFGNFMRKANIDELPQFINVLQGRMSIVGPRPHMLAHTEEYSAQIGKYMVRHFVKPGITGWAQVTGFRGETKELWQMEERVRRDIWYIDHWTLWLDIRIIWMTAKSMVIHDKNAY